MSFAVIDASALFALLSGDPGSAEVERALGGGRSQAPVVIDAEILSALRRQVHRGHVEESRARQMLAACRSAPLERVPLGRLLTDAWELRENVRPFDALYVALARLLHAPLITADAKLAGAPDLGVPITLLPA